MADGINTIRIIDEDLNEVAERLVYVETNTKPEIAIEAKSIVNDSLMLSLKTNAKKSDLSISILPENTICTIKKSSILGTMYLNGYLSQPEEDTFTYFDNDNKTRKADLELLLLNQNKNKYLWSNIKLNPPKITHPLTQGITIKGAIEKKTQNSKYKISLLSIKNKVFEETTIDKNNQFTFENVVIQDSTVVLLQIMDGATQLKSNKIKAKTVPLDSISIFQPRINKVDCPKTNSTSQMFSFGKLSTDKSIISLKDVVIASTSTKLIHKEKNPMAKAFKVGENELGTLLDYIDKYSNFIVGFNKDNSVYITQDRRRTSFATLTNGSPTVFIDDLEIFDLNFLFNMNINEISEVYFDDSGISERNIGGFGTIKIYLKEGYQNNRFKIKNTSLIITNAFTKNIAFNNTSFETAEEFNFFGTLSWLPEIVIEANQTQEIKAFKGNQKAIQVLLEGFSEDGQLISQTRKIPVANP